MSLNVNLRDGSQDLSVLQATFPRATEPGQGPVERPFPDGAFPTRLNGLFAGVVRMLYLNMMYSGGIIHTHTCLYEYTVMYTYTHTHIYVRRHTMCSWTRTRLHTYVYVEHMHVI